ncbi:TrmH family RNA methyltransferase [Mycoplasma sp. CSL7503-lung]|uniref:TrmH family RNA methyltransferase n=1 Tax=Mycoplasma sp. CSL7503-lung TaxID=536372 RepID=UPI0021CF8585|nr:RNA methyltransferase [Mycoplasma sp. CSL7503-lung]MCU4706389.1 RNA methyltransferase [Mycoplasma sp. CSL7503-lung]
MILSSRQNPKIKFLKKLLDKKYRRENNKFLVFGYHLVEEAKNAGIIEEIFEIPGSEKYKNSTLIEKHLIDYISPTKTTQPIFAICNSKKIRNIKKNKVILLNNVQDPGNIGTIFRLAKAFDFDTVIVENTDPYNDKIIRSSQGAMFSINIIETKNGLSTLEKFKKNGFKIYGTLLDKKSTKLNDTPFDNENIVVIFGNEGSGIEKNMINLLDQKVYIPISFESLNVSMSAAIILNKIRNG